jgi:hypothetical protein
MIIIQFRVIFECLHVPTRGIMMENVSYPASFNLRLKVKRVAVKKLVVFKPRLKRNGRDRDCQPGGYALELRKSRSLIKDLSDSPPLISATRPGAVGLVSLFFS